MSDWGPQALAFGPLGAMSSQSIWRRLAVVTGLGAVAFVAPLLDLYGRNPEVFVANRTSVIQIVAFGLGVALVIPMLAWAALALANVAGGRVPDITYRVIVVLLAIAAGLVVSRQTLPDLTLAATAAAVVVAALVYWLVRVYEVVFVFAAVALPVLLVMFLGTSATARLIWSDPLSDNAAAVDVGTASHLVMIQLDEMPLASIMDLDGTVNEDLFPTFARLVEEGTWYRNALSDSIATTQSVPSILTGTRVEPGTSPSFVDHPDNLFTLLAESHEMHVIEWVAEMCPEEVCPDYAGRSPARFTSLLGDVGVVYGHLTLPGSVREGLPSIDNSWKGFLGQDDNPSGLGVEIPGLPVPPPGSRMDWIDWVQRLINGIDSGIPPTLSYAHLRAPHVPWVVNPSGTHYERPEEYTEVEGVEGDGTWSKAPEPALLGFQRHLYQLGFLDTMLGRLIDHLQATGTWDDTMFIVVADHGASFVPGEHRRWPYEDNRDDLYRVPLFIKYPGQPLGETVDLPVFGIDIVPTIVDVLEVETDWHFDGLSLVDLEVSREHDPIAWCCNSNGVSTDLQGLFDQVRRNHDWIPDQSSWLGVASAGPDGDLVGTQTSRLQVDIEESFHWSLDLGADLAQADPASGKVQTVINGRVALPDGSEADHALIAIDDVVAGVAHLSRDSVDGASMAGILAEELIGNGDKEVEILIPDGDHRWLSGSSGQLALELVAADGHVIEVDTEGNRRIQVDRVKTTDQGWEVVGWAADVSAKTTPETIYVFAADNLLLESAPNEENRNVVSWFESEDLLESGFRLQVDSGDIPPGVDRLLVVAEFGDTAVADPVNLP